jgi:ferredoxin
LAPDSERGSDLLLIPSGTDYLANVATPKGEALVNKYKNRFSEAASTAQPAPSPISEKVRANMKADPEKIKSWLDKHFDDPIWQKIALRCHGCGACAYVCPTCHCFDIVDELDGVGKGCRRRNWDACQPALFTLHGSGHNPRKDQSARFRQRIMHKFTIYPSRFGEILCTGCGRCIRVCAAGMDLIGILEEIGSKAEEADSAL